MENLEEKSAAGNVVGKKDAGKKYICKTCNKGFKHQRSCGKAKALICKKCNSLFKRNDALKGHQLKCESKPQTSQCQKCNKTFLKSATSFSLESKFT